MVDWAGFEGDSLPDATWGICQRHNPGNIVRLVDDHGAPAPNGVCQFCWMEMNDASFFTCPEHGILTKAAGRHGCPIPDCVGAGSGPTEAEIEREADALGRVWPGGAPLREDVPHAEVPGPESERDREARPSAPSPAGEAPRPDGGGVDHGPAWRDLLVGWRDPFLEP